MTHKAYSSGSYRLPPRSYQRGNDNNKINGTILNKAEKRIQRHWLDEERVLVT